MFWKHNFILIEFLENTILALCPIHTWCNYHHHLGSVWIPLILLKIENWKHCSKIIFKCANSAVRPIFNESFVEKRSLWVPCTVHRIHKLHFSATFSLKMSPTALFIHLKIILLQCFQFSIFSFSKISSIQTHPKWKNFTMDLQHDFYSDAWFV